MAVCPRSVLDNDPSDAWGFVEWWLDATTFDPWSGRPGLPEWPYPGGMLRQPARIAEAVSVLRAEWPHATKKPDDERAKRDEKRPATPRARKGRR